MNRVWVWAEHQHDEVSRISLGLVGKARQLCEQLGGGKVVSVLAGTGSPKLAQELIDSGSDRVYLAKGLSPIETERCAGFVADLVKQHQPGIFLWGATSLGRETAARVAARVGAGLTAHCVDLNIEEIEGKPQLVASVAGWGGNLMVSIICPERRPQMATVKPGMFPPPATSPRKGEIIPVDFQPPPSRVEVIEVVEEPVAANALEEAEVVIAAGWGLNSGGGFPAAKELAEALGGTVAGTRPAVDAGWISHEQMIGQSGKTIAPKLLVTLGVSGAAQFTTAALSSKFIVAVDKNPHAPIFEVADIGIVGDLREVLPRLIEKVRAVRGKG